VAGVVPCGCILVFNVLWHILAVYVFAGNPHFERLSRIESFNFIEIIYLLFRY